MRVGLGNRSCLVFDVCRRPYEDNRDFRCGGVSDYALGKPDHYRNSVDDFCPAFLAEGLGGAAASAACFYIPQPVSEKLLQRAIEFRGVDFTYPEADSAFIKDLSIEIKRGQMVGVIGPSGAGKSTFIDLFLALLEPDRGNVRVDGVDVAGQRSWWQQQIAYVPQSVYLMNDTLRRNVGLGMNEEDVDDLLVMEALKKARLADLVKSLPNGLDTEIGERGSNMSGGQIQEIGIARALFCDRPVLVFDEPTSALDSSNEQHFLDVINQLKGHQDHLVGHTP